MNHKIKTLCHEQSMLPYVTFTPRQFAKYYNVLNDLYLLTL